MAGNSHNDYDGSPVGHFILIAVLVVVLVLFALFCWPLVIGILS